MVYGLKIHQIEFEIYESCAIIFSTEPFTVALTLLIRMESPAFNRDIGVDDTVEMRPVPRKSSTQHNSHSRGLAEKMRSRK